MLVKAPHSVGKSQLGGGLVNWFFDCWAPSITITTAPTQMQVQDILWKEVRQQRRGRPGLLPKDTRMEFAPNHFAVGYTATNAGSFQGRHEENVLIIFDEATGIDSRFWIGAEGMLTGENCYWVCFYNPIDTASQAFIEEHSGKWHLEELSCLNHPNIALELSGERPLIPSAVRLEWIESRLAEWCTPVSAIEAKATDFEFPPSSGAWYRPGPEFESKVLGRWPSQATNSVWSDAAWRACLVPQVSERGEVEIGCDVARFGDDFTSIVVRKGRMVLHHETHNGWSTSQTAGRLKELAIKFATDGKDPKKVKIKIDDDGVGGGVVDQAHGYNFIAMSSASRSIMHDIYPNKRSELWFNSAELARNGEVDVSRLTQKSRELIRAQLFAPTWKLDSAGKRVVEPKSDTKKRLKRSPDDADAFNLAFASSGWASDIDFIKQLHKL